MRPIPFSCPQHPTTPHLSAINNFRGGGDMPPDPAAYLRARSAPLAATRSQETASSHGPPSWPAPYAAETRRHISAPPHAVLRIAVAMRPFS
jgi:hypothetical protein